MMYRKSEKGQAGLEFVIITPIILMAIFLLAIIGNQLYMKLTAQSFAYSHCMWELSDIKLAPGTGSAFSLVLDDTKKIWNTEGIWENFSHPSKPKNIRDFDKKTCVGSVTLDDWSLVGIPMGTGFDPSLLMESSLTTSRAKYSNSDILGDVLGLSMWIHK